LEFTSFWALSYYKRIMQFHFSYTTPLPVPAGLVFDWHRREGAFERLSPSWMPLKVHGMQGGIEPGGWVKLGVGPFGCIPWKLVHGPYEEGKSFTDQQESGPFRHWQHTHRFESVPNGTHLHDEVVYELPRGMGFLKPYISRQLVRLFHQRAEKLQFECRYPRLDRENQPIKVAVTGSTGLIGKALVPLLRLKGHQVVALVRHPTPLKPHERRYDPLTGEGLKEALHGVDAVIHLAGESIAGYWTAGKKEAIAASRIQSTRHLAAAIAQMERPPSTFVMASGIGYYGATTVPADENAPKGKGFLADVVDQWEKAIEPLSQTDCRVVKLRLAPVLSPLGGMLPPLLWPHRLGLGPSWGGVNSAFSWISLEDAVPIFYSALTQNTWEGVYNVASPEPTTPKQFARAIAAHYQRPQWLHLPSSFLRLIGGEAAQALLLTPNVADSKKLVQAGYRFRFSPLKRALRFLLA
jgi:uncharacterized protein (TIGR01777 family)